MSNDTGLDMLGEKWPSVRYRPVQCTCALYTGYFISNVSPRDFYSVHLTLALRTKLPLTLHLPEGGLK